MTLRRRRCRGARDVARRETRVERREGREARARVAAGSLVSPCVAGARARPGAPAGILGAYVCAEAETDARARGAPRRRGVSSPTA